MQYRVSDLVSLKLTEEGRKCPRAVKLALLRVPSRPDPRSQLKTLKHNLAVLAREHEPSFGETKEEFVHNYQHFVNEALEKDVAGQKRELLKKIDLRYLINDVYDFTRELAENRFEISDEPCPVSKEVFIESTAFGKPVRGRIDLVYHCPERIEIVEGKVKEKPEEHDKYQVAIYALMERSFYDKEVLGKVEAWPSCKAETVDADVYTEEILEGLSKLERMSKTPSSKVPKDEKFCETCWFGYVYDKFCRRQT